MKKPKKLKRKPLKPYTLRIRPDQQAFLKTLENASSFVREAIDVKVADTQRVSNERVIALHEGYEELKEKISGEKKRIEKIKEQLSIINGNIEKANKLIENRVNLLEQLSRQEIHPVLHTYYGGGCWYDIVIDDVDKRRRMGRGDTEEDAIADAKETVENQLPILKSKLAEFTESQKHYTALLKAHEGRLKDRQVKLEKLKKCIM